VAPKSREKILLWGVVIAVAIWAFDGFYYTPQKEKIMQHREGIRAADLRLQELLVYSQGMQNAEAEVSRLEKELQEYKERMLKGAEFRAFLKHLAQESDRLEIKMISLKPQEEKTSPPEEKKSTSTFQYRRVSVQMVVLATYRALNTYLLGLEELPFLTVDHMQIEQSEKMLPLLQVTLGLSVHMIS
jgi:hypothetical protein